MGYSKAPEQLQNNARPLRHSHTVTSMGANQPPYALLHIVARRATHCATKFTISLHFIITKHAGLILPKIFASYFYI